MVAIRAIKNFEYLAPDSLQAATNILETRAESCKVLAGGTDLILQMKQKLVEPSLIMDLKGVPELNLLEFSEQGGLRIGAAVPISRVLKLKTLPNGFEVFFQACSLIGSIQIKNRGTIGGNICNAAPSADSGPPLLCLEARVKLVSHKGSRTIPLNEFFLGPGETVLAGDEILTEIIIPTPSASSAGSYMRHTTREEMDIAVAGVASFLNMSSHKGKIESARIALGAVAATPLRALKAESVVAGKTITKAIIEKAAETASEEARPISDVRGSAEYRRELVRVLTRRTLEKACEMLDINYGE